MMVVEEELLSTHIRRSAGDVAACSESDGLTIPPPLSPLLLSERLLGSSLPCHCHVIHHSIISLDVLKIPVRMSPLLCIFCVVDLPISPDFSNLAIFDYPQLTSSVRDALPVAR
jgi:hypothetical protein